MKNRLLRYPCFISNSKDKMWAYCGRSWVKFVTLRCRIFIRRDYHWDGGDVDSVLHLRQLLRRVPRAAKNTRAAQESAAIILLPCQNLILINRNET